MDGPNVCLYKQRFIEWPCPDVCPMHVKLSHKANFLRSRGNSEEHTIQKRRQPRHPCSWNVLEPPQGSLPRCSSPPVPPHPISLPLFSPSLSLLGFLNSLSLQEHQKTCIFLSSCTMDRCFFLMLGPLSPHGVLVPPFHPQVLIMIFSQTKTLTS